MESSKVAVPTADDLRAAAGRRIPDLVAPGLTVLFCGINPGLYSAALRRHFARPGNRFWPALHMAGFTERLLQPHERMELIGSGYGITSLVPRATATARELTAAELRSGPRRLARIVRANHPKWVAVLGVTAYRTAFGQPKATIGLQSGAPIRSRLWVLPSPSGANGSYPFVDLVRELRTFRDAIEKSVRDG